MGLPRYHYTISLLFCVLALVLMGCGGSELECRDDLGCLLVRPGEPIRIALLLSFSGEVAFLGEDSRGGVEIAIDDRGGELLEHPLELVAIDAGCSTEQASVAAEMIIADAEFVGIIGPNCSDVVKVVMPSVESAGLVMISPSATAPELTQAGSVEPGTGQGAYFRTAHNNLLQARTVADYAYTVLGARRAAVIYDESTYAQGLQQQFAEVFQNLGGTVVFRETLGPNPSGIAEKLATIAGNSPDVLYLPVFEPEGALIVTRLAEVEGLEHMVLMGADSLLVPTFPARGVAAVNGMYLSGPAVPGTGYEAFLNRWMARYGAAPSGLFHAHAYDATTILMDAIETVAQVGNSGTLLVGRRALRQAVAATAEFDGLTGTLTC
ncbi:MAG TPA: branched-chain amino acid ABC transporter substrate-binding protein, partial [Anaerolineae bacterium]